MKIRARADVPLYRGRASIPKGNYAVPALDKAFDIIELLARMPGGALISEMAAQLNRSIGELFRIVIVMEKRGFLQKSPDTDRYTVAYKILDIAYRATPAQDLARASAPQMEALALAVEQSCHLVAPNGGSGLAVARQESPGVRGFALRLGAPVDLIASCSGHVLLAFSRPDQTSRMLELAQRSRGAPIDQAKLEKVLRKVREQGFDMMASPITHGVTDISCPVFGFHGEVMAALTIPFLELIDGSQKVGMEQARQRLHSAAQRISSLLGYYATR
ncbi:MAG: IclR family transcriptional regulator [Steroidobacteraceae bacterium]